MFFMKQKRRCFSSQMIHDPNLHYQYCCFATRVLLRNLVSQIDCIRARFMTIWEMSSWNRLFVCDCVYMRGQKFNRFSWKRAVLTRSMATQLHTQLAHRFNFALTFIFVCTYFQSLLHSNSHSYSFRSFILTFATGFGCLWDFALVSTCK